MMFKLLQIYDMVTESSCALAGLVIGSCIGGLCVIGHCVECCGLRSEMVSNFYRVFPANENTSPEKQRAVIVLAPKQLIVVQNPDDCDMHVGLKISYDSDQINNVCRKIILDK